MNYLWGLGGTIGAIIVCAWALWRGELAERIGALIILIAWLVTPVVQMPGDPVFDYQLFTVDLIAFVGLFILSAWSRKLWTLFASALQLITVMSYFSSALLPEIDLYTFLTSLGLFGGFGHILTLAAGVWSVEVSKHR